VSAERYHSFIFIIIVIYRLLLLNILPVVVVGEFEEHIKCIMDVSESLKLSECSVAISLADQRACDGMVVKDEEEVELQPLKRKVRRFHLFIYLFYIYIFCTFHVAGICWQGANAPHHRGTNQRQKTVATQR